jgi:NAD(P)-dependent dehydrogenase (short-subunit alcohol dehydrogenase family)
MDKSVLESFKLDGKVAIVTGGAGLLGVKHAEAIAEAGGIPVLWDINSQAVQLRGRELSEKYDISCLDMKVDITNPENIKSGIKEVLKILGRVDILINNAANDPKVTSSQGSASNRLENFPLDIWEKDIAVGLTGAFLCSRELGSYMSEHDGGVILNIVSDLGVIAPDQRIYQKEGIGEKDQNVKPVTYSVVKHGIIGLTKYLATYWRDKKVRINAISPGGIYVDQSEEFVQKLTNLIPMGRMAQQDEYKAAVLFLVSDASSYMTGANLVIDGGRTVW